MLETQAEIAELQRLFDRTVSGTVERVGCDHPDQDLTHETWQVACGVDPYSIGGDVTFFRIVPASACAYASHPEEFPES